MHKKENWKRRRVCGVRLLFLLIGVALVVIIATVAGAVDGPQSKDNGNAVTDSTVSSSPAPTNTSISDGVCNQPSDPYFTNSILYSIMTELEDGKELRFEGAKAHNGTPVDAVFLGKPLWNDSYQR